MAACRVGAMVWFMSLCLETNSKLSLSLGVYHSCALGPITTDPNVLKCWGKYSIWVSLYAGLGANKAGALGYGDTEDRGDAPNEMGSNLLPINLGSNFNPSFVGVGCGLIDSHTCAQSDTNELKCFGDNSYGELGYGHTNDIGDEPREMGDDLALVDLGTNFPVMQIDGSQTHSCALSTNGKLKCFGLNNNGNLGYGDTNSRGDTQKSMGDDLLEVDLGNFNVSHVSVGAHYTCALSTEGTVKCWGVNNHGQLGCGDTTHRGDTRKSMGDNLLEVDLGTGFIASYIDASVHICALSTTNAIKCWGANGNGQLGAGDTNNRGDEPGEMGDNLLPIDLGSDGVPIQISVGSYHSCALLAVNGGNKVKCWGSDWEGQLGYENANSTGLGDEPNDMGDNLPFVDLGTDFAPISIHCGGFHTCAVSASESVKCFGYNGFGELGYGDTVDRGSMRGTMGDSLATVDLGFLTLPPSKIQSTSPSIYPSNLPTKNPSSLQPSTAPTKYLSSPPSGLPAVSNAPSITSVSPTQAPITAVSNAAPSSAPITVNPTPLSPTGNPLLSPSKVQSTRPSDVTIVEEVDQQTTEDAVVDSGVSMPALFGIICAMIFTVIVLFVMLRFRMRKKNVRENQKMVQKEVDNEDDEAHAHKEVDELEMATNTTRTYTRTGKETMDKMQNKDGRNYGEGVVDTVEGLPDDVVNRGPPNQLDDHDVDGTCQNEGDAKKKPKTSKESGVDVGDDMNTRGKYSV
eukprot:342506_1